MNLKCYVGVPSAGSDFTLWNSVSLNNEKIGKLMG